MGRKDNWENDRVGSKKQVGAPCFWVLVALTQVLEKMLLRKSFSFSFGLAGN